MREEKQKKSIRRKSTFAGIAAAVITVLSAFYFLLIPLNPHSIRLWMLIMCALLVFASVKNIVIALSGMQKNEIVRKGKKDWKKGYQFEKHDTEAKWFLLPAAVFLVFVIIMITGMTMTNASKYADIIHVEDAVFEKDLAETLNTDSIALMDTRSAQMLGDREIGSLSEVVSQYDVSDDYTQIDYNGTPKKVAALDYAGFFKWKNNRGEGVPGYVVVDPVSMAASYQKCKEGMRYVPSAYFSEDAARYIWKHYPTELLGNLHFEIDEEGNPYYVTSVYKKTISLFGGKILKGVIVLNPTDGELQYYEMEDVPQWIDEAYDGDLLCQQYNWYGELKNGFVNSIFAKKGCKQVTTYVTSDDEEDDAPVSDYGYVAKDGDIWIYTGVTSVNGDSSNIGFLLANERTGEAHYYTIAGADEKSAMAAAEGEVQEKRYQASFPSLINVDGEPTYIMVMKDASGLVKLYAAVNVEQYNLVATASSQKDCIGKYRTLIGTADSGEIEDNHTDGKEESAQTTQKLEQTGEEQIVIADIKYIDISGNTYIYLITDKQKIYRAKASEHEEMLLLQTGDIVHVSLHEKEILTCKLIINAQQ